MKDFYANNYYIKNAIKFSFRFSRIDLLFRGAVEYMKIMLINLGLMKPVLNERVYERPFVLTSLPKGRKLKILDLGCGDSIFPVEMKSLGHEVWGADPKNYLLRNKIRFVRGDFLMQKDKFSENYFDVITCISAIEHFGLEFSLGESISRFDENRKDIDAIKLCRKLLKKGGLLILTTTYGKKALFKNERVYDEEEIKKMTSGFKLLEKRIIDAQNELLDDEANHSKVFMAVFKKT